jgi:hypothetical protein
MIGRNHQKDYPEKGYLLPLSLGSISLSASVSAGYSK